jgi:hypothetical protein
MTTATITNALTDWLSAFAMRRSAQLAQGARRFASLINTACELETASPVVSGLAPAKLSVDSGLHRGATMELTGTEYVIGSGDDCDVVLHDASFAARHCVLRREWSGFALRDLQNDQAPIVPRAVNYRGATIEIVYDVSGVVLTVWQRPEAASAVTAAGEQARPRDRRWVLGGILAAVFIFAMVAFAASRGVTQPAAAVPAAVLPASRIFEAQLVEQVSHTFASDNLRIGLQNGRLSISGNAQRSDVKDRIRSLTADLQGIVAVDDGVRYVDARDLPKAPGPFPVRLRGVMIGNPSYFVTDGGTRYFAGGVLPDGAEVVAIESERIRLQIAGRTVIYSLE